MIHMPVSDNFIRLLGRYSEGLRLAAQHGPRSAVLFEYAYENTPNGHGTVGRWIDRTFLSLWGWNGIRQRIQTTKELLTEIVAQRRTVGQTSNILDVASGTARYLRELVHEQGSSDLTIACRDRDPRQVMYGRELVQSEHLRDFSFSVGDATDGSSYLTDIDPDIILAVGLFPYLREDVAVRRIMQLAFQHLKPGGCFICTTLKEPHGRLPHWEADALIAPPAMRSPQTIADWLASAGFIHVAQRASQPNGYTLISWKPDHAAA